MVNLLRGICPNSLRCQILALMVGASLFMVVVGGVVVSFLRFDEAERLSVMPGHLVSVAVAKLNETTSENRPQVLEELLQEVPDLKIELVGEEALINEMKVNRVDGFGPFTSGATLFGMRIEYVVGPRKLGTGLCPRVFFRLRDGSLVAAEWVIEPPPFPIRDLPFYMFFGFLGITFLGLMSWVAKGLVQPLSEMVASAQTFGERSTTPIPIAENGPNEIRVAARAFNRMQLRINEFVDKRTRMLAAISHDMGTPLTRLRLRLEFLEDSDIRNRSLEDLNIMEQQIEMALNFLRDGSSSEPVLRIDIPSLLQSLSDQYADLGFSIETRWQGRFTILARNAELTRAISNLIDNAIQYASAVEINAGLKGGRVWIDIIDHGPGIPESERERLQEPFERGDQARKVHQGTGFGLGLATSKTIVEAAAGSLELRETKGGGLTVRLQFPAA
ncbi:MAG: HAMP domain-containing protein [Roseibium sp.]|uniref:ATP-binding protein n=1 Tax=Roseibium sp. TaxID=1936156 RepID=UPI00261255DE|nr:ATP-binding protein [Roseibium sp.]MCV0428286.1 HAMP domain-containing protein [Roseibium sp.]